MARLVFRLFDALGISSRRSNSGRRRSKAVRSRHALAIHRGGELLEVRSVPSATPIVGAPVGVAGFETAPLTNVPVATFTQGDNSAPASNFLTMIFWGDGTSSAGTVVAANGMYTVVGSHTYTDVSELPITVGIEDATTPTNFTYVTDNNVLIAALLPNGTPGTVDQRFVYEALKDTLQRPITMADVNFWTSIYEQNHSDPQTFAFVLLEATPPYEFYQAQVESAYKTYLHRDADPAGETFFVNLTLLSQGAQSGPGTEKRTAALLINSDEFYQDAGGTLDGFITAAFKDALKRPPSASDLAYFEYQLTHGMSHIEFATTIMNSNEFEVDQVNGLFERYLGRPADNAGLLAFVNDYNQGYGTTTDTETMLDTPEFYNRAVGLPLNTVELRD